MNEMELTMLRFRLRFISARLALALALTLFIATGDPPLRAQDKPQMQPPTFRAAAEGVQVTAYVTDAAGNPVRGLTAADFEILEDRQTQPITTFSEVDIPLPDAGRIDIERDVLTNEEPPGRVYLIALDELTGAAMLKARHHLRQFIERHVGPHDKVSVVHVGRGLPDSGQDFTSNRRLLLDAIERFTGGFSRTSGPVAGLDHRNKMNSLKALVEFMAGIPGPRKAMLFVTDWIAADALDVVDYRGGVLGLANEDFQAAVSAATRGNVAIYPIDPMGLNLSATQIPVEARPFVNLEFRALGAVTGGFALTNSNDFTGTFERLVKENSSYYVLGFNSAYEKRDGRYVPLEVRVRRPGMQARTMEGYVAPSGRPKLTPVRKSTLLAAVGDASRSPLATRGVAIRLYAAPFNGRSRDASIAIVMEIDPSRLNLVEQDGVHRGALEITFAVTDARKKRQPFFRHRAELALKPETLQRAKDSGLRVLSQMALPQGRYQIRGAAGDDGIAGSVVYDLEVPDFRKDLSMSGIALSSTRAREAVTVSPHKQLDVVFPDLPLNERDFDQDDRLSMYVQVYENRRKSHTVNFRMTLRDATSNVVAEVKTTRQFVQKGRDQATHTFTPNVLLEELTPGDYTLVLEAESSLGPGKPVSRQLPFRVVATDPD